MITKTGNSRKIIYDPREGRDIRDVKATLPFVITSGASTVVGAAGVVASSVVGASENIVITSVGVGQLGAGGAVSLYLRDGSSTVMPIAVSSGTSGNVFSHVETSRDEPLWFSAGGGTRTIALYAETAGTYTAYVTGVIEPDISKVEV